MRLEVEQSQIAAKRYSAFAEGVRQKVTGGVAERTRQHSPEERVHGVAVLERRQWCDDDFDAGAAEALEVAGYDAAVHRVDGIRDHDDVEVRIPALLGHEPVRQLGR